MKPKLVFGETALQNPVTIWRINVYVFNRYKNINDFIDINTLYS